MIKLSVTITCFNNENIIAKGLKSVEKIADEIVVIDSFSTDDTVAICEKHGARVIQHKFLGYIEQKNLAIDNTKYDYILSIDSDEAIDDKLCEQILKVKNSFKGDGYYFNRLTNYAGYWVKHCGWYPDKKIRLIHKERGRWGGENPHDKIIMKNEESLTYLRGNILHYSYDSISDHINQTNRFTTINAEVFFKLGVRSSLFKIVTRPVFKFLRDYFFKLGFLDGSYGFVICYINALSAFLKYAKIKELEKGKKA